MTGYFALADTAAPESGAAAARKEQLCLAALSVPSLLLIACILVIPLAWLMWLSVIGQDGQLSAEHYRRIWESPSYLEVFRTTFMISFVVTVCTVLIGYPLAYCVAGLPRRITGLLMIAVILPYWISILVRTYAWLVLLQRRGVINQWLVSSGLIDEPLRLVHNFTGTTIGMVHIMLPFLVLPLYASMRAIDPELLKAAASLGATPIRVFWKVYFPLCLPGLLAGVFLVFVLCLGFYVTPAILGGGRVIMIAQQMERSVSLYANWGATSALGVVLLALTFVILYLAWHVAKLTKIKVDAVR